MESQPGKSLEETITEQIFDGLSSGVLACDAEGAILRVNPAACRHLGLDENTLVPGHSLRETELVAPLLDLLQKLRTEPGPLSRMELALSNGESTRILGITATPLQGGHSFLGAIFLFIDLTEVRRLERLAALNQQLAQIGELTAGVVHELRNPLSVISGMSELLMRKLQNEIFQRRAQTIFDEANQMGDLITQFLSFARPFTVKPEPLGVSRLIERTHALCEHIANAKGVTLSVEMPGEDIPLEADCEKIAQALSNIVRNAIEASGAGKKVSFGVRQSGKFACFRCEDSGSGIHLNDDEDLFNAFFTKKPDGTGLGLSIAHRMVMAHNGTIEYGNCEGGGAWFEVSLPLQFQA